MDDISFAPIAFGGSRHLGATSSERLRQFILAVPPDVKILLPATSSNHGALAVAAAVAPRAYFFHAPPDLPIRQGLPARSVACLRALAAEGPRPLFVCFPGRPAPPNLVPGRSWVSCGSGSWSEIALALGLGISVAISPGIEAPGSFGPRVLVDAGILHLFTLLVRGRLLQASLF